MHLIATPLVTKADGTKFGKTEGGAVWLDPEHDVAVRLLPVLAQRRGRATSGSYLRVFTFRSRDGDRGAGGGRARAPAAREAQRALADEVTTLVHGAAAARPRSRRPARRSSAGASSLRSTQPRCATPPPSCRRPSCAARAGGAAVGRRPARRDRAGGEPVSGPAGDRRGWRLRQQRAGDRRGRRYRPTTTCWPAGGCCCAEASARLAAVEVDRRLAATR